MQVTPYGVGNVPVGVSPRHVRRSAWRYGAPACARPACSWGLHVRSHAWQDNELKIFIASNYYHVIHTELGYGGDGRTEIITLLASLRAMAKVRSFKAGPSQKQQGLYIR